MLRRIGSICIGGGLIALIGPLFGITLRQAANEGFNGGETAIFGVILIFTGLAMFWINNKLQNKQPY